FLTDPNVLRRIVAAARPSKTDTVLEIGPGRGDLTRHLAQAAGRVFAVELDRRLIPSLQSDLGELPNVHLVRGDALTFPFHRLPPGTAAVANLPYNVATPILMRLVEERARFSRLVLMFQKEVADRIAASPGTKSYGSLTLAVRYAMDAEILFKIAPGAFSPPPKVDSAVVQLIPLRSPRVAARNESFLFAVIRAAFGQRRKTLRNALRSIAGAEALSAAENACRIDLARRGETLSLEEFARLTDFLFERTGRKG
ncbi:MAG: ribosomal RNA small subunit methyltransferase A, partial [Nitrospirae bacterium]|nr:ribosomal RNA small subunit methyltransferase A [Nitrospirota bacterium]